MYFQNTEDILRHSFLLLFFILFYFLSNIKHDKLNCFSVFMVMGMC